MGNQVQGTATAAAKSSHKEDGTAEARLTTSSSAAAAESPHSSVLSPIRHAQLRPGTAAAAASATSVAHSTLPPDRQSGGGGGANEDVTSSTTTEHRLWDGLHSLVERVQTSSAGAGFWTPPPLPRALRFRSQVAGSLLSSMRLARKSTAAATQQQAPLSDSDEETANDSTTMDQRQGEHARERLLWRPRFVVFAPAIVLRRRRQGR